LKKSLKSKLIKLNRPKLNMDSTAIVTQKSPWYEEYEPRVCKLNGKRPKRTN